MTERRRPSGGGNPTEIEYVGVAKRVSFLVESSPQRPNSGSRRRKSASVRITVGAPRLDSFAVEEVTPAAVLRGAGLDVANQLPASDVIEAGLPAAVVRDFALASGMTPSEIGPIIGASDRTMSRKLANDERLGAAESDRAYRLFDVVARAVHAFGDADKARRWMRRVIPSLGGRVPIDLLRTEIGTRDVLSALDRIEYGGVA
jgi:putative toxin-antitoxin system antitoxin component (TIGR02293 family)